MSASMQRRRAAAVGLAAMVLLAALFLLPLAMVVRGGVLDGGRFSPRLVLRVLSNPVYAEGLRTSLLIAAGTTIGTVIIGLPLAWIASRREFRGRETVSALVLLPMLMPPFVGAIGLEHMLGRYGALNALLGTQVDWLERYRLAGVIALQTLSLYPILFLNASAALANVDPALEEAAATLGAHGVRRFIRVTLPLMFPGLFAGAAIVFIWSFTELGTPLMLGLSRCAPVQVYDSLKDIGDNPEPYALVLVMLALCIALYTIARWFVRRYLRGMPSKGVSSSALPRWTGARMAVALGLFGLVSLVAALPHLGVVLTSLSQPGAWYRSVRPAAWTLSHLREAWSHELTLVSIRNSLLYAGGAVALDLVLALAIARVVTRSDLRWRGVLDLLATLPLAVPGLVMAFGFLALSARLSHAAWVRESSWAAHLFDIRTQPALFLTLAYAIRRLPFMARAAVAGLQQTPQELDEAAATLGARPLYILRRISMPLIGSHLLAGALLTFAFSVLEVSDSLLLAQRMDFYPITKAMYELFSFIGVGPHLAAALGVWAMLFLGLTLFGASRIIGRRFGALFRV
ncbi:MAG: iron ABC transporter permease [Kiritimatiellae bacterium]|nr:iron ABC transporter permease [Kiritimatiellia bacterium]